MKSLTSIQGNSKSEVPKYKNLQQIYMISQIISLCTRRSQKKDNKANQN